MMVLMILASAGMLVSFTVDKRKTWLALKSGGRMFADMLPFILVVIVLTGMVLFYLPDEFLAGHLGKGAGFSAWIAAALAGSVALIPGCVVYPLAGMLVRTGVSYAVIAVFITTLKMVGVVTLPLEAKYFGIRTALLRNLLYLAGAVIVGLCVGCFY